MRDKFYRAMRFGNDVTPVPGFEPEKPEDVQDVVLPAADGDDEEYPEDRFDFDVGGGD
jgi:hypothetical protein